jgi:tetratricopeptide (TPR) repeat protein
MSIKLIKNLKTNSKIFPKNNSIITKKISIAFHQGLALHKAGQLEEARAIYEEILKFNPRHFDSIQLLGAIANQNKNWIVALELFKSALKINQTAVVFYNQGIAFQNLDLIDDAQQSYENAIKLDRNYIDAYINQGNLLRKHNQLKESLVCYDYAIELNPSFPQLFLNKGNVLRELKFFKEALLTYDKAIYLNPDFAEAYSNRGVALQELKQFDKALDSCNIAIKIKDNLPEAYCNVGNILKEIGKLDDSLLYFKKALEYREDFPIVYFNQALVFLELNMLDNALLSYNKALELDSEFADVHWNKSHLLLLIGDFKNGLLEFEWRWRTEGLSSIKEKRNYVQPLWLGKESLVGKVILLWSEQGLGDTLQFCRYVKFVANLGAKVILDVHKPLFNLLQNLDGVSLLTVIGGNLPDFDYHCPLMSLPLAFNTTIDNIPNEVPYIYADSTKIRYWKNKLSGSNKLKVGLVWSGGFRPNQPELWGVNERRNLPFHYLNIFKNLDINFYSLQKGDPAESEFKLLMQSFKNEFSIIDYTDELLDFTDTAALIHNLNMVISVDTSTAHLAAAMGKPVWILNRFDTCWRWLLNRTDSPWYPTVKLYRQENRGDWESVCKNVYNDLLLLSQMA